MYLPGAADERMDKISASNPLTKLRAKPRTGKKTDFVEKLRQGQPQRIVVYGTSLTAGGAWVKQLADALEQRFPGQATVINSGQSAMWSQWGVENLQERVLDKNPDAVFIEFAVNDAFLDYQTSVEQARRNLETMIDRIDRSHPSAQVILMVMNPPIREHCQRRPNIERHNQMNRDVAAQRKLTLIDHWPAWMKILLRDPARFDEYVPDGIHPAEVGCRNVVTPGILRALGL
jgi:acyl-CoA thioesterase-1